MAPEIFRLSKYDEKVDIFSLGVVMYHLMYQRSPFAAPDASKTLSLN